MCRLDGILQEPRSRKLAYKELVSDKWRDELPTGIVLDATDGLLSLQNGQRLLDIFQTHSSTHMRWTYSGVMPARSIEQDRISFSTNYRRQASSSSFTVLFILLPMHLRLHHAYQKVILIRVEMVTSPSQSPKTS